MTSSRRVTANRKNATRSTGPRSIAGKQRASQNSMKHGLTAARPVVLAGETEAGFEGFRAGLNESLHPVGAGQAFLVEIVVQEAWSMRRADRLEAELFDLQILADETKRLEAQLAPAFRVTPQVAAQLSPNLRPGEEDEIRRRLEERRCSMAGLRLGTSFLSLTSGDDSLGKLQRYRSAHERSFYKALHELERMQRRSAGEDVAAPRVAELDVNLRSVEAPEPVSSTSAGPIAVETSPEAGSEFETTDSPEPPMLAETVQPPAKAPVTAGEAQPNQIPFCETNPSPAGPEAGPPGSGAETIDPSPGQRGVPREAPIGAGLSRSHYETKPPVLDQRVERMEQAHFKG